MAERGRGCIYPRGGVWWIKFYRAGEPVYESSGSRNRAEAERLLVERTAAPPARIFGHCPNCGVEMVRILRTA